jgi:DNA-directed RNA polymerase specialized sigma24 family protein
MGAAQNGHGGAYRRLLGETSVWLKRYFERRLPPGHVDDAVQETLLAIHRRRHTYDEASFQIGLSASAVKMNIHRGLARLTALIEKTPDVE